jgi:hypothetical protein
MDTSKTTDASKRLETLATEAKKQFTLARKGSAASLLAHKAVGEALIEAKELCPNGYLKWAKENLDIGKQWCAHLTFLAANWADYDTARSWAEVKGQPLGRKEYGVEGAVALIKRYRKAMDPSAQDGGAAPKRPSKVSQLKGEVESLKRKLAEKEAQNELLWAQVAGAGISKLPEPLDDSTRRRAEKTGNLWRQGGTAGECTSAEQALRRMAAERGWLYEAFLKECGIERPVNWTSARAA